MTSLFVTSSGTDIGKTAVCCRLLEELPRELPIRCIKPVATGFDAAAVEATDTGRLLRARGLPMDAAHIEATTRWRFAAPLSADMAAAREGSVIPFDQLVEFCRAPAGVRLNLIEGIGGVMAPIDARRTVLDWIAALECPAWLVVGSYLGTLSHTLTALEALLARGIEVGAIIVSQSLDEPVTTDETVATIERFASSIPVRQFPRDAAAGVALLSTLLDLGD